MIQPPSQYFQQFVSQLGCFSRSLTTRRRSWSILRIEFLCSMETTMHFGVEECRYICWRKDMKYGNSLTKDSHRPNMNKVRKIWYMIQRLKILLSVGLSNLFIWRYCVAKLLKGERSKASNFQGKFWGTQNEGRWRYCCIVSACWWKKHTLECLGELVETKLVFWNILKTLLARFNPKVSV